MIPFAINYTIFYAFLSFILYKIVNFYRISLFNKKVYIYRKLVKHLLLLHLAD